MKKGTEILYRFTENLHDKRYPINKTFKGKTLNLGIIHCDSPLVPWFEKSWVPVFKWYCPETGKSVDWDMEWNADVFEI